jgi:hypothetical protein
MVPGTRSSEREVKMAGRKRGDTERASRTRLAAGAGLGIGAALGMPAAAQADDFPVTNLSDGPSPGPPGSLREALDQANALPGPDRVLFQSGLSGVITLTDGDLEILDAVQVLGPGPKTITIDGDFSYRAFYIDPAVGDDVAISGLTMTNGSCGCPGIGGAIASYGADLTVSNSVLTGNAAEGGSAIYGGNGDLTLRDTTVNRNFGKYGAILHENPGVVTIDRSTIAENQAYAGFSVVNEPGSQPWTIVNSTIAANTGGYSGGVLGEDATLLNTIVADNTGTDLVGGDFFAAFSLIEDQQGAASVTTTVPGSNIFGVDPRLEDLADNGGSTPTMALPSNSPAVDKGASQGTNADQRGLTRPLDYLGVPISTAPGADASDIGAFELQGKWECKGVPATIQALPGQVTKGTPGDDVIVGTLGAEKIRAGSGDDTVCAGAGKDIVSGQGGDDDLRGQKGNDGLNAGKGDDVLRGGKGNDTLRAGPGKDVLKGGPGRNKLIPFD